jgi:hypothetical protein
MSTAIIIRLGDILQAAISKGDLDRVRELLEKAGCSTTRLVIQTVLGVVDWCVLSYARLGLSGLSLPGVHQIGYYVDHTWCHQERVLTCKSLT